MPVAGCDHHWRGVVRPPGGVGAAASGKVQQSIEAVGGCGLLVEPALF